MIPPKSVAAQRQLVNKVWAEWLDGFLWDHFVTLTFRKKAGPDLARQTFARWVRCLEQEASMPVRWFVGLEDGHQLGRLHMHSLLGNTGGLDNELLAKKWIHGYSNIKRYKPGLGAAHYVTKYVTKDLMDYDVSPNFTCALPGYNRWVTRAGITHEPTEGAQDV